MITCKIEQKKLFFRFRGPPIEKKNFFQRVTMARLRQRKIILNITTSATEIKKLELTANKTFLAKSNMLGKYL